MMSKKVVRTSISLIIIALLPLLTLNACKKKKPNKLENEWSIFVGTWEWVYTTHRHNYCEDGAIVTDTLTPESENEEFKIEFKEEGQLTYYRNEVLVKEYDIYFNNFNESLACSLLNSKKFNIAYEFGEESSLNGCINVDTIRTAPFEGFLFSSIPGCEDHNNYFVKI